MSGHEMTGTVPVVKITGTCASFGSDEVVREVPLTVFLNGREFVSLVCSPQNPDALVAGFLLVEGLISSRRDIVSLIIKEEEGAAFVRTAHDTGHDNFSSKRRLASSSGRDRPVLYFSSDAGPVPVKSELTISPEQIFRLNEKREDLGTVFRRTGGTHGAALCTGDEVMFFYEDIGRHNAVDKVLGKALLDGHAFGDKVLFLSGRISSEIVVKAGRCGIPVVASKAAPTQLALDLAQKLNITVVGFTRKSRLNIYTVPRRVINLPQNGCPDPKIC